jgi:hypothetical protein
MEGTLVQQVLKVALLFPVLWDRVRKGLVPFEAGGTVPIRDF